MIGISWLILNIRLIIFIFFLIEWFYDNLRSGRLIAEFLILEDIGTFKREHTPRAARYAFTTRQAGAILDRCTQPGVPADVDPNGAVEHAHAALHTAIGVRDYLALDDHSPAYTCSRQYVFYIHSILIYLLLVGLQSLDYGTPGNPTREC